MPGSSRICPPGRKIARAPRIVCLGEEALNPSFVSLPEGLAQIWRPAEPWSGFARVVTLEVRVSPPPSESVTTARTVYEVLGWSQKITPQNRRGSEERTSEKAVSACVLSWRVL